MMRNCHVLTCNVSLEYEQTEHTSGVRERREA